MHVKEPRTFIDEEPGLTLVFLVQIASTLVYSFSQACELQRLSSPMHLGLQISLPEIVMIIIHVITVLPCLSSMSFQNPISLK